MEISFFFTMYSLQKTACNHVYILCCWQFLVYQKRCTAVQPGWFWCLNPGLRDGTLESGGVASEHGSTHTPLWPFTLTDSDKRNASFMDNCYDCISFNLSFYAGDSTEERCSFHRFLCQYRQPLCVGTLSPDPSVTHVRLQCITTAVNECIRVANVDTGDESQYYWFMSV